MPPASDDEAPAIVVVDVEHDETAMKQIADVWWRRD